MKIALAQIKSIRGNISLNKGKHLFWIKKAIGNKSDLIVFPELSMTGFNPSLAKDLALDLNDCFFNDFQEKSDDFKINIMIGMPTVHKEGIRISTIVFEPSKKRNIYSKQILHEDEIPYFISGENDFYLKIKSKKIALGICYETMFPETIEKAKENDSDIYLASVAKSKDAVNKAFAYYSEIARESKMNIAMVNAIGPCEEFENAGCSALWNVDGERLFALEEKKESLLLWGVEKNTFDKIT